MIVKSIASVIMSFTDDITNVCQTYLEQEKKQKKKKKKKKKKQVNNIIEFMLVLIKLLPEVMTIKRFVLYN